MKYAHVINNTINELVESDPFTLFVPGYAAQFIEVADEVQAGWKLVNGEWTEPEPVIYVPQEVTMRQARLALHENNLLVNVQPAINSLPEPDKTKAQIEWEYSNALQRSNPFVAVLGTALGLSSQDLDDLFIQASAL
jgi:hypothetical protein